MADSLDFNLIGLDEVLEKMKTVEHAVRYKAGRFALRKAANLVRKTIADGAQIIDDPATVENIAKNVAIRWDTKTFKRTGNLPFRVGILGGARDMSVHGELKGRGKKNPGGDTWYWRFLEFGTEKTPAKPFVRPALTKNTEKVAAEFVQQFSKALERALKKKAGKK